MSRETYYDKMAFFDYQFRNLNSEFSSQYRSKNLSKGFLIAHQDVLEKLWALFEEQHRALIVSVSENKNHNPWQVDVGKYSDIQKIYVKTKATILDLLDAKSKALLQHNIPIFSGSQTEWNTFSHLFQTQIGLNISLNSTEKLELLKEQVSGEVSHLIDDIQGSKQNYDQVWKTLTKKYDNKRILVDSYLSNIYKQQSISEDFIPELKKLLNTTIQNLEALRTIGRPLDQCDLIVYVIVEKLDARTRQLWGKSLENSTNPPSFEMLRIFLESRILTLEDSKETF